MKKLVPVVIFTYKRLNSLQQVISSLKECYTSDKCDLYIFSDGPKDQSEIDKINSVRNYLRGLDGFNKITLFFSEQNKGLANSIIEGVTSLFERYDSIIVLEDDLIVSKNFLVYMNKALTYYKEEKRVFSISGYNIPMKVPDNFHYDIYFTLRASSWGWASWKDRWDGIDWTIMDFEKFGKDKKLIKSFNQAGSDMFKMLKKQKSGKIDSWAIRWCYHQFKNNLYCVYPITSKVKNIGFNETASNSNTYNRYNSIMDSSSTVNFRFPAKVEENDDLLRSFRHFLQYYFQNYRKSKIYFI